MYFLSIESSTKSFSLALSDEHKVIQRSSVASLKLLENAILPKIDALCRKAGIPFEKIDAFFISIGPGSFTSLRVGLSTVKAFCMATGKPLVGVSSLEILANGAKSKVSSHVCAIMDARRGLVYSAVFARKDKVLVLAEPYRLQRLDDLLKSLPGPILFTGDAIGLYQEQILAWFAKHHPHAGVTFAPKKEWAPKAAVLAKLGAMRYAAKQWDDPSTIVPLYLYEDACQVDGHRKAA